jgi:hypothetical protein
MSLSLARFHHFPEICWPIVALDFPDLAWPSGIDIWLLEMKENFNPFIHFPPPQPPLTRG